MTALNEWDSFYVIVGSAAGALIGLQFVVMTLMADRPVAGLSEAGRAFGTPTVVHFSLCLLLAALVRVPWPGPLYATTVGGIVGLCGVVYEATVVWRMRRQSHYRMDLEDMTFHVALPVIAYVLLAAGAAIAPQRLELALFGLGAAALILLFVGIHNAWDAVAWQVYVVRPGEAEKKS
ncbi:MAG TPA: hypothetical protein VG387_21970 [Rhizomicrobium sp.]|jgi:hypothetical protein|nr:hypothetical protein [Rhizomicrobium sp.]